MRYIILVNSTTYIYFLIFVQHVQFQLISLFDSDSRFTLKGYTEGEKTKVAFKEREVTRERGSKNQINAQK